MPRKDGQLFVCCLTLSVLHCNAYSGVHFTHEMGISQKGKYIIDRVSNSGTYKCGGVTKFANGSESISQYIKTVVNAR